LYTSRHGLNVAETNDFRYAMEEVSGLGLEWFFEQWCYRPGCPELSVKTKYDGEKRELMVEVAQTQKIDARTPAFRFRLPVAVRTPSGEKTYFIDVNEKNTVFRTTLDGPPSVVAVDPNLHVLKTMTEDKPLSMWIEQAKNGPTIVSRHDAVDALGKTDSPETIALLSQMIRDDKLRYTLRNTAVSALAGYASPEAREALLTILKSGVAEAKVRSTLIDQLHRYDKEKVMDMLADAAANDPSYAARVAAIEGLANLKAKEKIDVVLAQVEMKSQHDQVRSAALRALADLDESRGLDLAIKYSAYGYCDRSRPTAITCLGKLAKHNKDKAVTTLLALLNDPESRSVSAAGSALAELGDDRAVSPITAMSETHRDPDQRKQASEWLKKLQEKKDKK